MKLNQKERNFITVLIAIIAALFILLLYLDFKRKAKPKKHVHNVLDRNNPEKIRIARIRELLSKGYQIQNDRYLIKEALLKQEAIRLWVEKKTIQFLHVFRWLIFSAVFLAFAMTWIFSETIVGYNTDDVLRITSVSVILFVLVFFASSEENDSLKKCYQRVKPFTFICFMYIIRQFYKLSNKEHLHLKDRNILLDELKAKYEALVPIMDELRRLDKGGF